MINRKIIIMSLFIIILMSVQFVAASDNADINIIGDNEDNGVLQTPSETKNYTDLKNLIDSDTTGEITLDYNYKYNNGDPRTGINITKNLVINGNGAIIDGSDASGLFNISNGVTVTLKNLTITHAAAFLADWKPENCFHAITSQGDLNILDCTFDSNTAGYNYLYRDKKFEGCAIYSNANINIQNSIFQNNLINNKGIVYTTGRVTVNNSRFSDNHAVTDAEGGAIWAGEINIIENSTFERNIAATGGAIFINNTDSITSIRVCPLINFLIF